MATEDTQQSTLPDVAVTAGTPATNPVDPEAAREDRKLRHWIIRCLISTMSISFLLMILAIIYAFVFQQRDLEKSVLGEFLSIFGDVVKIMAAPPPQ